MKLGIIVGHTSADAGALSAHLGMQEYPWNKDLATRIGQVGTQIGIRTFLRDQGGIAGAYQRSDAWGSDITTELHFNSAHNQNARGTGILYDPGSSSGKRFAGHLFDRISAVLETPDWPRGTGGAVTPFQASGRQRRGQRSLQAGRAPATLIEPFFGSSPSDSGKAGARKDQLAEAIVRAAEDWFNG
ncbi:MAG: N-acetylmuramoyl-L-alanine amidase [Rhodobacteraceae bacterium]|nr:N-acetylmuramoyl-L-alanine amidase [Paracoccaceae bacterium]